MMISTEFSRFGNYKITEDSKFDIYNKIEKYSKRLEEILYYLPGETTNVYWFFKFDGEWIKSDEFLKYNKFYTLHI